MFSGKHSYGSKLRKKIPFLKCEITEFFWISSNSPVKKMKKILKVLKQDFVLKKNGKKI